MKTRIILLFTVILYVTACQKDIVPSNLDVATQNRILDLKAQQKDWIKKIELLKIKEKNDPSTTQQQWSDRQDEISNCIYNYVILGLSIDSINKKP